MHQIQYKLKKKNLSKHGKTAKANAGVVMQRTEAPHRCKFFAVMCTTLLKADKRLKLLHVCNIVLGLGLISD